MLSSFVIELEALDPITLNGYGGEAIHGLFFEIIGSHSPKVADFIHNENRRSKPFSLSGILEKKVRTKGELFLDSGENASFRISILEEDLIPDTLAAFGKALNLKAKLPLANGRVIIKRINYQEGSSRWVGSSLYPKLFEEAKPAGKIRLRFFSPTSFRIKGKQCTLPAPYQTFSSLMDKWNSFSGIPLKNGFLERLREVYPSQFELRSELIQFSNYKIIGFRGVVEYRLGREFTSEEKRIINALADFAFYAGVGYKTTMGMGQTVRIDSNGRR
jgi:CRISPR-associated endoribonuclease Cas6